MESSFLIKLSDNRRKVVEAHKRKQFLNRKTTIPEQFVFNIVPICVTSSLLAPLHRIKILLQTHCLVPSSEGKINASSLLQKIMKEQGYLGLWRGNNSNNLKILAQSTSRILFFDRIKFFFQKKSKIFSEKKYKIPV
jgi:hypothetical protein